MLSSLSQFYVWGMFPPCPILDPEALAPAGLCCPSHQHFSTPSASLTVVIPFPATGGYRFDLWHSRIILPDYQTFRAFTAELSRIAAFNFRREPDTCTSQFLRCRHWPSGRPAKPLAPQYSCKPTSRRRVFSTINPFALATALLFARPTGLVKPEPSSARLPGTFTSGLPAIRSPS